MPPSAIFLARGHRMSMPPRLGVPGACGVRVVVTGGAGFHRLQPRRSLGAARPRGRWYSTTSPPGRTTVHGRSARSGAKSSASTWCTRPERLVRARRRCGRGRPPRGQRGRPLRLGQPAPRPRPEPGGHAERGGGDARGRGAAAAVLLDGFRVRETPRSSRRRRRARSRSRRRSTARPRRRRNPSSPRTPRAGSWTSRCSGSSRSSGQRYTHGHVVDFLRKLRADPSRLEILGDGKQRKSYLDVADCVARDVHVAAEGPTVRGLQPRGGRLLHGRGVGRLDLRAARGRPPLGLHRRRPRDGSATTLSSGWTRRRCAPPVGSRREHQCGGRADRGLHRANEWVLERVELGGELR